MKHGSLFSGIGGFDLAAEWMGWENMFHCEWNEFCKKVLKYYWPNAISYGDIDETDFTIHRGEIDVLSGGFPCQPYSNAGKRKGKEDERHKWPQMLRAAKEIQPSWLVGENVSGLINWNGGMVLHEIKTDLESAGFEVFPPCVLPACSKDAPHRRDRLWVIAYSKSNGINRAKELENHKGQSGEWGGRNINHIGEVSNKNWGNVTANSGSEQLQERSQIGNWKDTEKERTGMDNRIERPSNIGDATDTNGSIGCERGLYASEQQKTKRYIGTFNAPGNERNTWDNFPTQPPLCSRNDGLSGELVGITFSKHRSESIKGYGNAIVPQVAYEIFKAIEQYELQSTQ